MVCCWCVGSVSDMLVSIDVEGIGVVLVVLVVY